MSMIEGIGDEVIQFFAVITVLTIGLIAWWSTNISESPLITTVLILERRSRTRASNETNNQSTVGLAENGIDTGQGDSMPEIVEPGNSSLSSSNDDKEENTSQSSLLVNAASEPSSETEIPVVVAEQSSSESASEVVATVIETDVSDTESSMLRRRRLAFFQSRGPTLLESSSQTEQAEESPAPEVVENEESAESSTADEDHIRIRLKYLNDDQIVVEGRLQEELGAFKRRHFSIELAAEKMVRLIFNGQVLQSDSQTLQGYGLFDNCVVHCLVHNQRNASPRSATTQTNSNINSSSPPDWNLGTVLYTCLSILLGFAWYCRYEYSHLFTVTTTAALFGLTAMFTVTIVGLYLPETETIQ